MGSTLVRLWNAIGFVAPHDKGAERRARGALAAMIFGLCVIASAAQEPERIHVIPFFPSASDAYRDGLARVINHSGEAGEVRIEGFDEEGEFYGAVMLSVDAGEAVQFSSEDLESGNAEQGLSGATGPGEGDWRLELTSERDIEVLSYVRPGVETRLEARPGPRQHARPGVVEQAHHQEQEGDDGDERHQRRLRTRGQHPVVDLEHEQRAGQHQQVHEGAEQPDRGEPPAALAERRADLSRPGRRACGRHRHRAGLRYACGGGDTGRRDWSDPGPWARSSRALTGPRWRCHRPSTMASTDTWQVSCPSLRHSRIAPGSRLVTSAASMAHR